LGKAIPALADRDQSLRAGVKIDGKSVDPDWLKGMQAASNPPNVFCKVSALVEGAPHTREKPLSRWKFYEPVLNSLWRTFGSLRLIYGSNWPVSRGFASYANVQRIVSNISIPKGSPKPRVLLGTRKPLQMGQTYLTVKLSEQSRTFG